MGKAVDKVRAMLGTTQEAQNFSTSTSRPQLCDAFLRDRLCRSRKATNGNIVDTAASEGATALATSMGEVYLFAGWERQRVAARLVNIVSIKVTGGKLKVGSSISHYTGRPGHPNVRKAKKLQSSSLPWLDNSFESPTELS